MAWDAGGHIVGNIINEPRTKTLDSGATVTNFTVEARPRHQDTTTGEWRDVKPVRIRCNAWHELGQHVQNSLHRGDRVVVVGRFRNNDYTDPDTGVEKIRIELDVDIVGPDLRHTDVEIID